MTHSDDDDKTRIQSSIDQNDDSDVAVEDDSAIQDKDAEAASDRTVIASNEEQRRYIAELKAKEMEQRLAQLTGEASDETRIATRPAVEELDDKTRIAPAEHNQATDLEQASDDATRFQFQSPAPDREAADDATRIQTKDDLDALDSTVFKDPVKPKENERDNTQDADDAEGDLGILKGRFIIQSILGAGGMGVVYKAKDKLKVEAQDRDPYVAIKVLGEEFKAHPEAFISLQRESRKTQSIAHPNIVNVHDFDRDGDTVFMTMEYLEGEPLDKLISRYKATGLPEEDAWKVLEGISAALIYAHDQKIIHSDFKPGNIFVTNQTVAKVFDFGIARAVAKAEKFEDSEEDKTVFDAGSLGALTPAYASLEMLQGETPDIRDDIYALGCIAYEMFTGQHPYSRIHADEAQRQKLKPKRIPNITKRQWRAIEKCLAFKREDRIASVEEFWEEITRKSGTGLIWGSIAAVALAASSLFVYQNYFAPPVIEGPSYSEDEIRSEIEQQVLIEQNQNGLAELLETLEFTPNWEKKIFQTYTDLQKLLGAEDAWLLERKTHIANAYYTKVGSLIDAESFTQARDIMANIPRYSDDTAQLEELNKKMVNAEKILAERLKKIEQEKKQAAAKKQQAAKVAKETKAKNAAFDVALETVNKQLACRTTMNMRDVDIAIDKLKSLNSARFRKAQNDIVAKMALCIAKVGRSFPERAEELKKRALRTFPKNTTLSRVKIEPKDPCDLSLAGLGARGSRAICRDILKSEGETFGKGPAMVVIPAKGSLKAFALGKYEVTYEDFNKFCEGSDKCKPITSVNEKMPVTRISNNLMNQYLNWLSVKSKRKYRLPSKAEWVYAARASSSKMDSNRNCRLDSRGIKKGGELIKATTGRQNTWGLVNHLGNAQELVVNRGALLALGGSFETEMQQCVVTASVDHNGAADSLTGFRVLREIEVKE